MRPEAARGREGGDCWGQRRQQFLWDTSSDSRRASPTGSGGKPRTTARCSSSSSPSELRCCWKEKARTEIICSFSVQAKFQIQGQKRGTGSWTGSRPGFSFRTSIFTSTARNGQWISQCWLPPGVKVNYSCPGKRGVISLEATRPEG